MEERARLFEQHRALLEGIAYRMTGTMAEAKDIVQDTWVKWSTVANPDEIRDARAWLVTACSRLALDMLRSARVRRERYCGVWLPEPYHVSANGDPAERADIDETISMALLLAMEKLSPHERAAFLLHDVFGYGFDEIARIIGKTSSTCRKIASRARASVRADKPRFTANAAEHRRLLDAFLNAAYAGEVETLRSLLAESVEMHSDGGGKVEALQKVMRGAAEIAEFLVQVLHARRDARMDLRLESCRINGMPGVLIHESGRLATALTVAVGDGRILAIYAVRNPEKLRGFKAL